VGAQFLPPTLGVLELIQKPLAVRKEKNSFALRHGCILLKIHLSGLFSKSAQNGFFKSESGRAAGFLLFD
jgi:hypothetical protein